MGVAEHPYKVVVAATAPDPGIPERGWVDMDVRWLVTKETVGSTKTVFGVTFFPPGAKHDIHRHPNAEEVEYLVSGPGLPTSATTQSSSGPARRSSCRRTSTTASRTRQTVTWSWRGTTRAPASLEDAGFVTRSEDEGGEASG